MTEGGSAQPSRDDVEARPAATVVLVRPGPGGPEVLLTQRPATMAFAGDMHVFPGGRVDPTDGDSELRVRSVLSADAAAAALGGDLEPGVALAAHMAAIRELFEEAGVLLATAGVGIPPDRVAIARTALLRGETDLPSIARALDLELRTDLLIPLSRWVTPRNMARRFDARFFAAALPDGIEPTFEGGEVVAHAWHRPVDALVAMADGRLAMWLPTSTTLQQLEHVRGTDELRDRLAPGPLGRVEVSEDAPGVTRIDMPAGGGVAGQPVCAYLIGSRGLVLVDPGDPTGLGVDRALELATARAGVIEAVALTHVDPDHAAGAQAVAEQLGVPVFTGPGGGRPLPYDVHELGDLDVVAAGDMSLRAVLTPGPRPDHVAFVLGDGAFVIEGDLGGIRGARSIPRPPDEAAWAASVRRLHAVAPGASRLAGHPPA